LLAQLKAATIHLHAGHFRHHQQLGRTPLPLGQRQRLVTFDARLMLGHPLLTNATRRPLHAFHAHL
jgi:hypothetical protein